jgi:hypothetical protein
MRSPVHTLLLLFVLAAISGLLAFRLPLSRAVLLPLPYGDSRNVYLMNAAATSPGARGLVIARLREAATYPRKTFQPLDHRPLFFPMLLMVVIAILILWNTTGLSLGEYPAHRDLRRWLFFGAKLILLVPIVFGGALDLASLLGVGILPPSILVGTLYGLRWAILDQRNRCPVCLRLLGTPTRIGAASRMFLEWYGTELVCGRGHGLLYVPGIPSSGYSIQRWQSLDSSWTALFTG